MMVDRTWRLLAPSNANGKAQISSSFRPVFATIDLHPEVEFHVGPYGTIPMPNADFQDRLQRIGASSQQRQTGAGHMSTTEQLRTRKTNYGLLAVGSFLIFIAGQSITYLNENYDAIRDSSGIGVAVGLGFGALAAFPVGVILMVRAIRSRKLPSQNTVPVTKTVRRASTVARVFFSLLGFVFGAISCLYMFMVSAAGRVETDKAEAFSTGGVVIALFLAIVSLLFGFVGIFLRGYALGRVPVYFLLGGMLTYAAVHLSGTRIIVW